MQRYVICPVVQGGLFGEWRPAISNLPDVNVSAIIPTDPSTGVPKFKVAFCAVTALDWAALSAVAGVYVFPDFPLDSKLNGMSTASRQEMLAKLEAYDIDGLGAKFSTTGFTSGSSFREAVKSLVQQLDANAATINAAIPQPARGSLTAAQKARLLVAVIRTRYIRGV
jgi:hypothetical protein